jgi:DNA polymerase I-like protein with 3'-5' exonuclease and polymerase domains
LGLLERHWSGEFDPHRYLGSVTFKCDETEVSKRQRKTCKPYTHGRTYLGGETTLAKGAGHTVATAKFVCAAHERAFRVKPWQDYTVKLATREQFVDTALGWRRYFWDMRPKPTEILATRIQGTAADLMKVVLVDTFEDCNGETVNERGWEILTTTHDSLLVQVPKADAEEAEAYFKAKLEQRIEWLSNYSWRTDSKTGPNWKEV